MSFTRRQILTGAALNPFRMDVKDEEITKVGIVPFFTKGGVRHYLIASPKPSREEDKDVLLPFTLARGTRKGWIEQDGEVFFEDLDPTKWKQGDPERPFNVQNHNLEPLPEAALREGREELAVHYPQWEKSRKMFINEEEPDAQYALKSLHDCGVIKYKDYPIRFYAGELAIEPPASYQTKASPEVRLITLKEATRMAKEGSFKPDYLERLKAIDAVIESHQKGSRTRA